MIEHGKTLLSEDIFDKQFVCNLDKCKGACCIEGDMGAPLDEHEIGLIEQDIEAIKPYMTEAGLELLHRHNFFERDDDGDLVTACLPTGECVFAVYDGKGVLGCGIENAYKDGKTSFRKPVSCHLYPIRIDKVGEYDALNYHKWDICSPACSLGKELQVPVFSFLKDALTRQYGQEWYAELESIYEAYSESKEGK